LLASVWLGYVYGKRRRLIGPAISGAVRDLAVDGAKAHLVPAYGGAMVRRGAIVDMPSVPDAAGDSFRLSEQPVAAAGLGG
jgi:hypothetical protein